MPWFEGTHSETRALPAPPAAVKAHFASPAAILAATKKVEASDVTDGVIHFVLKEEDHGVVKFKADYRCKYELVGDRLVWTAAGGNLEQSGEARFEADGSGTKLVYTEKIRIDLGVPALMAPMLQPMIGPMLAMEAKDYVKRMVASLG
jgi:hypothetical protein